MSTIAVVIPTFNRAATLALALRSVFAQTRPPDEVLVVDDASSDDTPGVVAAFPGSRYVRLERNGGAANARNEGIRRSSGELIAFLDSDDAWAPDKLALQLASLQGPARPDLVCTGITVHNNGGGVEHHGFSGLSPDAGWAFDTYQSYPFCPSTWLIRRSVFEAAGLFDAGMRNCEDLEFLARISGQHRIQVIADRLVVKHNRDDSLDADLGRTALSFETLFERYPGLWAKAPRSVVTTLVRLATMQMSAGDRRAARASLWRAARGYPAAAAPWALLVASLFGARNYMRTWRRVA